MADYYQLKNQNIFNPPANTSLGNTSNQFGNAFVQNDLILGNVTVTGATIVTPKVSTIGYPGDDTAADPAGGQTITLTGSGFLVGASVLINGSAVGVVSVVSSTTITFTSPANSAGSYVLYVINTDGGTAIAIPGIQYSGVPTWTTAAGSLGSLYETQNFNSTVTATGDAPITYSLFSGSIPPGATFNSNGTITGTSQVLSSSTTYTFTVRATDAEAQDTNRSFSLTINPDVVTWSSPANGTTYTSALNSAISNVTLVATSAVGSGITYTANALPVGLSLTGANISGTPTVEANSSSLLTATANTTSEASSITINWVISVANDPYFEYNTLLIPGASTTFVDDASTNNFAVTINGDTKPNNFNPYTPGYYSNYFDGTGDYLTVPVSTALALSANYTIECWIYPTVAGQKGIYTSIDNTGDPWQGVGFEIYTNNCPRAVGWSGGSSSMDLVHQTSVVLNTWNHIALCRNNNLTYLYLNGVQSTSSSADSTSYAQSGSTIGQQYPGSSQPFTGYISNLRVVKGTAVYTAAFTPPTSPLTAIANTSLLTCQSNSIIDNSTNAFTLTVGGDTSVKSFDPFLPNTSYSTYGSGYFDGTGDYLSVSGTLSAIGTDNFTIECWVYITTSGTYNLIDFTPSGTNGAYFNLYVNVLVPTLYVNSANQINGSSALAINTWNHIAVSRASTSTKMFVNGVQSGSTYSDTTSYLSPANRPVIAASGFNLGVNAVVGYITDVRVIKGTAVYTTTFTPPSAPLTAVSGTSLLTLQNNQSVNNSVFLDNSTNNFLVTRFGNTTQGTFSPYGGNWSNLFTGAGSQWLSFPAGAGTGGDLGAGDFTLECWTYLVSRITLYPIIFDNAGAAGNGNRLFLSAGHNSINTSNYNGYLAGTNMSFSTAVIYNAWVHLALVRSGTTVKLYVNGVADATTYTSSTNLTGTTTAYIGGSAGDAANCGLNGYISNFRIVKGTAVYTSNFTPSTTPLTSITNTNLLTSQSNRFINNSTTIVVLTPSGVPTVQRFSPFNPSSLTPTSYSGYFDGTGDYLGVTSNSAFAFGTGAYSMEGWIYISAAPTYISTLFDAGGATNAISLGVAASGAVQIGKYGIGNVLISTAGDVPSNQWVHVAAVRVSTATNDTKLYVNGILKATGTDTNNWTVITSPTVGGIALAGYVTTGYISNLRVVKGVAVYTGAFTPPTSPLTATQSSGANIAAITGTSTSLLTCQSTTFIDNSTNNFTITAVGNSQPTIQNPFGFTSATTEGYTVSTIGGSGYFDGTTDYLTVPRSTLCIPGASQNFTIEAWVYSERAAGVTAQQIMGFHASGSSSDWILYISGSNYPIFYIDAIGTSITSSIIVNPYSWNHIAVVRKDTNTITLYVNGVAGGTATSTSTLTGSGANPLSIGSDYNGVNYVTKGYISNGRIVNGTALYTSSFVPPSAPLTAVQNTSLLTNMTSAGIYDAAMMNNMESVADAKLSTAISKFGGSSMYFDGTGDYLTSNSATTDLYAFGSGNFTIEMWLYLNSVSGTQVFYDQRPLAGGVYPTLYMSGSTLYYYTNTANRITGSTLSTSQWYHIAVSRSGTSTKLFVNGTQSGSTYTDTNVYLNAALRPFIGGDGTNLGTGGLNGYIDDLRVTKGYARYTSNFTAPTSAFPIF